MNEKKIYNKVVIATRSILKSFIEIIEDSPWKVDYLYELKALSGRVGKPCEIAIAGRVKAGKSSFLNALLGENLAVVGVVETTATINVFKYGILEDATRPILVKYRDGSQEYKSKDFLNSLQGNTEEVLKLAENIERLEYIMQKEVLKDITIVDTPGTDALVDEHEERVSSYFTKEKLLSLRDKQNKASKHIAEKADAVIFITADKVPMNKDKSFLKKYFGNDGNNSNAMNSIGIMSKIDLIPNNKEDELLSIEEVKEMSKALEGKMKEELSGVMPISAELYMNLQRLEEKDELRSLQAKLKQIPEDFFKALFSNDRIFLTEEKFYAKKCEQAGLVMLSTQERKDMLGDMSWRVFVVICQYLYTKNYDEAVEKLYEYSGMNALKKVLYGHFFNRSRSIVCDSVLLELMKIMGEIIRYKLPEMRSELFLIDNLKKLISNYASRDDCSRLNSLIDGKFLNRDNLDVYESKIKKLKEEVEFWQTRAKEKTLKKELLLLLSRNKENFSKEEIFELNSIAGMYHNQEHSFKGIRQIYWNSVRNSRGSNQDMIRIIDIIIEIYGKM